MLMVVISFFAVKDSGSP